MFNLEECKRFLATYTCLVEFTKADNTQRIMRCTTQPAYLFTHGLNTSNPLSNKVSNTNKQSDIIKAVDMDINEWRSFKLSSLTSFKLLSRTLENLDTPSEMSKSKYAGLQPSNHATVSNDITNCYKSYIQIERDDLIKLLLDGDILIEFEKQDGSVRVMNCTLNHDTLLKHHKLPKQKTSTSTNTNTNNIKVFDLDKCDWRTVNISKIVLMVPLVQHTKQPRLTKLTMRP